MGIKYFYSLSAVCFTVLFVSCDSSSPSSSAEEETTDTSYEETRLRSLYDDEGTLEATHVDHGVGESGTFKSSRPLKRFIVPISTTDLGLDIPISRPYYMPPQLQKQSLNQQHQFQQQQQQQQQQHQNQHQHQQQHQQQQHQQQYHPQQGQGPASEHFGFGPTSPGGSGNGNGGGGYVEQSDSFYQTGGGGVGGASSGGGSGGGPGGAGGENVNFDTTGFTDFVPSPGFRSPVSPSVPSSSAPFSASPQHHTSPPSFSVLPQLHSSPSPLFDEGSSGQMSFDPTGFGHDSPSAGLGSGYNGGGYDFMQHQHQAPVIHKSIYVHVAPPDDEPPRKQRVIMPNVPPKKNYQIVFIKAPTPPSPVAPIIPPPPQHSDKTLIYVLHPKPEEAPPIHIPPPPVTQPLKPEVYFIKYKNREESHAAGAGDYGSSGHGGVLPSPGEDFGGASGGSSVDTSGSYLHRRYGRGNQSPAPSPTTMSSSAQPPSSSAEEVVDDGGDGVTTSAGQREATSASVDYSTSGETEVGELLRGGYSTEYNDASVDSTNLSETHVAPSTTTAPKGKNGH